MNDQNRGGMTISTLLMWGLIASVAIPIVCLVVIGFASSQLANPFPLVVLLSVVLLVVGLIANYLISRKIKDRLLSLVDICRNFVGGDHSTRAQVNGDDEFAMLATSLNNLLDSQNYSSGGSVSASGPGDAAALQAQIEKLLQEVSAVGDGDLRVQAEVTPDTLGVLADSFNYMIEELAKVVGRVQNTAVQVTNASRRVLDRSAELAQASETQVERISQTTQSVEALASFVQNVAGNARLSAESAQEALRNAKSGQDAVHQSIDGMVLIRENVQETSKKIKRLGERSNEIGEIVRIIEDIADQTNLLALNAAIQSAMAGEHGRGFAVVADEIRLLAERSTESTKRIGTLVKSIQGDTYDAVVAMEDSTQEVVKGSQLADEVGRSLNSIYAAVERQAMMIESIARAANEQAVVAEGVASAMTEISEITNRTNAGTQEAAMSVSYLSELSDQLRSSVSTFRLPEHAGDAAEVFPNNLSLNAGGIPALPQASADGGNQFFQNGDWNQGFSSDFLSLPQPQEGNSNGFQFAYNGQQDFSQQSDFAGLPSLSAGQQGFDNPSFAGFAPGLPAGQQGFDNQSFGNFTPNFSSSQAGLSTQAFGNFAPNGQTGFPAQSHQNFAPNGQTGFPAQSHQNFAPNGQTGFPAQSHQNFAPNGQSGFSAPGLPNFAPNGQSSFSDSGSFERQQGFDGQTFQVPQSGFGSQHQSPFSHSNQMPTLSQQNFPSSQNSQLPARPRWRNPQEGQGGSGVFNPEQIPFPGQGNGYKGQ